MSARVFPANNSANVQAFSAATAAAIVTSPPSLGSGNYVFYGDGVIWDTTNNYAIPVERTNFQQLFETKVGT